MNPFDNPPRFLKMHARVAEIIHEMRQGISSDDIATAVLVAVHRLETHETQSGADTGSDVGAVAVILACPICGGQPDIDECGPATKETGPLGWYANCYGQSPHEHNVGVNADTRALVERAWNDEVGRIIRLKRREGIMADGVVSI